MNTITLTGSRPSPRYDGVAWTSYKVQEAQVKAGPWSDVVSGALSPVDADPKDPSVRSFTFESALIDGWYRIEFLDNAGDTEITIPRWNHYAKNLFYTPTVERVATKIISRTRDQYGNLTGTFSSTTTPTDDQVYTVVEDVITEVADVIGDDIPDELLDDAAGVVALKAAMQVELNFFSDQVNTGRSIYPQLSKQYDAALAALARQVQLFNEGETAVTNATEGRSPSYSFPDPSPSDWLTKRM